MFVDRSSATPLLTLVFTFAIAVFTTAAHARQSTPSAVVTVIVDDGTPSEFVLPGVSNVDGNQVYASTITANNGTWTLFFVVVGDYNTDPTAKLVGNMKITNNTTVTHKYRMGISMPICPPIDGGSLVGGAVTMTLTTVGPGSVSCAGGTGILQVTGDDVPFKALFFCPMSLTATGSSTSSSSTTWGLPGPNAVGPTSMSEIGEYQQFNLTGLDAVNMSFTLFYSDPNGTSLKLCPEDLDRNGIVGGSDLTQLLAHWEQTSFCDGALTGDIDANGIVDGGDLVMLLGAWGDCN